MHTETGSRYSLLELYTTCGPLHHTRAVRKQKWRRSHVVIGVLSMFTTSVVGTIVSPTRMNRKIRNISSLSPKMSLHHCYSAPVCKLNQRLFARIYCLIMPYCYDTMQWIKQERCTGNNIAHRDMFSDNASSSNCYCDAVGIERFAAASSSRPDLRIYTEQTFWNN